MLNEKLRRALGLLLVLTAFLIAGHFIQTAFLAEERSGGRDAAAYPEEETNQVQESGQEQDPAGFDSEEGQELQSILSYDLPQAIASRLNMPAFDRALVNYLIGKDLISASSGEEQPLELYSVRTDGLITEDVNRNVFFFDLMIDCGQEVLVTAACGQDHEYTFTVTDELVSTDGHK